MSRSERLWDNTVLLVSPGETKDINLKYNFTETLVDIRTDAASDADISLVVIAVPSVTPNSTFNQPLITTVIPWAAMNAIYSFETPYPMRIIRFIAYSPTGARLFLEVINQHSRDKIAV